MRMASPKPFARSFFRMFTESGPLIALAVAGALLVGIVGPASAQFFNFGGPPPRPQPQQRGGFGGGGWLAAAATCSRRSSSSGRRRRGSSG